MTDPVTAALQKLAAEKKAKQAAEAERVRLEAEARARREAEAARIRREREVVRLEEVRRRKEAKERGQRFREALALAAALNQQEAAQLEAWRDEKRREVLHAI